jgi:hypothetical protein
MSIDPVRAQTRFPDKGRLIGAAVFLISGVLLIPIFTPFWGLSTVFYDTAKGNIHDAIRLLWSISWCCIGFAFVAYRAGKKTHESSARLTYFSIYPLSLMILATLIFAGLHASKNTSNYLYYFFCAPLAFVLSFHIDTLLKRPIDLLKR